MGPGNDNQPWWTEIEQPTGRAAISLILQSADPADSEAPADLAEIELPTWRAAIVVILEPLGSWDPA